jgi:hypothetical protein
VCEASELACSSSSNSSSYTISADYQKHCLTTRTLSITYGGKQQFHLLWLQCASTTHCKVAVM